MRPFRKKVTDIKRKLADAAEFPSDCVNGVPDVEIRGGKECCVSGCLMILEYGDEIVLFDGGCVRVTVRGTGLLLSGLKGGAMCVKGNISSVSFSGDPL